ncbi:hypothetical protein EJD97_018177 [Solanum chilense]|uniref:Fungal lipase-type domain-containing protein n=1 Tax=Solanum chilense TaxID=4083 RepID=A0A6N2B1I4_SOLCI|nr:hypothetical protein EJD97_018177 [Solanum chilense]
MDVSSETLGKSQILCKLIVVLSYRDGQELKVKDQGAIYNHTLATTLVEYAASGFQILELIVDVKRCLQVHHGFYSAYHNTTLRPGVLSAVESAKEQYGDIPIMVTGHSMGGAMAAFCGLDLTVNYGSRNVSVMTFGQPRIGNAAFASYYSKWVPNTIRVTHEHDIVPHLPPYYYYFPQKTYHHFPREVWLHNLGFGLLSYTVEKVCDDSGEDPSCSRSVTGKSIKDHLTYYGVRLGGEESGFCKIVMDDRLAAYSKVDIDGNVNLSRDFSASVLRMNVESNEEGWSI